MNIRYGIDLIVKLQIHPDIIVRLRVKFLVTFNVFAFL